MSLESQKMCVDNKFEIVKAANRINLTENTYCNWWLYMSAYCLALFKVQYRRLNSGVLHILDVAYNSSFHFQMNARHQEMVFKV